MLCYKFGSINLCPIYSLYYKFRHSGDYPLNYDEIKLLVIIWWNTVFYCTILELGNLTITNDVVHFLSAQKILLHHMFEWLNLLTKYVQKFCRLKRSIWSMGRVFKPANDLYPEFTKNSNTYYYSSDHTLLIQRKLNKCFSL